MPLRRARPRFLDRLAGRRRVVAVCVGAAVVETILVSVLLPDSALGLATQVTAPPPFDLFHDLRWLVVYHESWFGFAFELLAILAVRAGLLTVLVRAAWPRDVAPEPLAVTARRSAVFVAFVTLLLAPWVGLMFALAVVSLSWLFFVAVPVVLMLAVLVAGGVVSATWWRETISWRVVGVVGLTFVAVSGFGSVLTSCPPAWRVPVAVVAGLVNAWLWVRLVDAVLHRRTPARRLPVAPIGIAAVLALVVGGTAAGFALSRHAVSQLVAPPAAAATQWRPVAGAAGGAPLLVVTGFNTEWDGRAKQAVQLAVPQRRFSYRGMVDGVPQAYGRADTHRSLRALARELAAQVDEYHRATGEPITLVAESEGALLAKAYVAATPRAPVRNLVVVSPLVEPGRVYYPRAGDEGWGAFGKFEMEALAWALGGLSPVEVTPDTPFLRSIVDDAPALRNLMPCALPGVRQAAVLPLDTGVSAPAPGRLDIPTVVVPGFHGGMLDDASTAAVVQRVVAGRPIGDDDGWSVAEDVIQAGASAWQVPGLVTDVNDAWAGGPATGDCRAVRAHLRTWLAGPSGRTGSTGSAESAG
jgi:hypothetical protein